MSNNNNIQDFDNFFKESFQGFEPPAPQGVWESLQTQLGNTSGASGAGTAGLTKAGMWGAGKIILASVATIAVATTAYLVINTTGNKNKPNPDNETTAAQNNAVVTPAQPEENINITPENETALGQNGTQLNDVGTAKPNGNVPPSDKSANTTDKGTPEIDGQTNQTPQVNPQTPPTNKGKADAKPEKQTVGLYLSAQRVCAGQKLTVTIADDLTKNTYRVNFGDGTSVLTQPGKLTTHTYKTGGNYAVTATEIGGQRVSPATQVEIIEVKAGFEAKNLQKAIFTFSNTSKGATNYQWYFGDDSEMATETSPVHSYRSFEAKEYRIKLLAINAMGCVDSFVTRVKQTYTYDDIKPKIPDVFSPGNDNLNDNFVIDISNEEKYQLIVLDRNGAKVFESTDANLTWDGRNKYTGQDCANGRYRYILLYKIRGFNEHVVKGTVDIIRK